MSDAEHGSDPAAAAAANRMPDVSPSPRGTGWIVFAPQDLDGHAADRADDLAAFESRHGPLVEAVPMRFRHLAVGRLYDMALGPRGA